MNMMPREYLPGLFFWEVLMKRSESSSVLTIFIGGKCVE